MSNEQSLRKNSLVRRSVSAAVTIFTLSSGLLCAGAVAANEAGQTNLVYVGTSDNRLRALRFDESSGKLAAIGPAAEVQKPRWTVAHPTLPILYSVNDDGKKHGSIIAFMIDRSTGELARLNETESVGDGGTYLWFDAASMTLLAANYSDGSASSVAINRDGSLGALVSNIKSIGTGPGKRQAGPHAHSVVVDPSGRYALVPDLGADRVFVYALDRAIHALTPDDASNPHSYIAVPGSGPRHLVFSHDGHIVYLLNELTADIAILRWDAKKGRLSRMQSLPVSSPDFQGTKSASEIAIGTDGRFVYVGDRGENSLVVYRTDPESGALTEIQRIASSGDVPWAFAIDPSGKWLLVANQGSGKVNVFGIDPASGKLADSGTSVALPSPLSITFVP